MKWMVLTVVFEFALGRYIVGDAWGKQPRRRVGGAEDFQAAVLGLHRHQLCFVAVVLDHQHARSRPHRLLADRSRGRSATAHARGRRSRALAPHPSGRSYPGRPCARGARGPPANLPRRRSFDPWARGSGARGRPGRTSPPKPGGHRPLRGRGRDGIPRPREGAPLPALRAPSRTPRTARRPPTKPSRGPSPDRAAPGATAAAAPPSAQPRRRPTSRRLERMRRTARRRRRGGSSVSRPL